VAVSLFAWHRALSIAAALALLTYHCMIFAEPFDWKRNRLLSKLLLSSRL
jgi:predicted phosphatase